MITLPLNSFYITDKFYTFCETMRALMSLEHTHLPGRNHTCKYSLQDCSDCGCVEKHFLSAKSLRWWWWWWWTQKASWIPSWFLSRREVVSSACLSFEYSFKAGYLSKWISNETSWYRLHLTSIKRAGMFMKLKGGFSTWKTSCGTVL